MGENKLVFLGTIVSPKSLKEISIFNGYLAVENGKITKIGDTQEYEDKSKTGVFSTFKVITMTEDQFLMPGFVDCHTHAPQFPNIGLGLDRPLLEWLDKYTFPLESRYSDTDFAAQVYDTVVKRLLNNGTTTACYFGSLHLNGTLELAKSVAKHHQRALVGKVSMNVENDAGYYNETAQELKETETIVKKLLEYENDLIEPVVTPRFAVSCDRELLTGLAAISDKYKCKIQSHISENQSEIEYVLQMFPECKSYADIYDQTGILNDRCIMAHAIYLSEEETSTLVERGVSIAHCPASNTRLKSGLCPVRKYIESNLIVGLGTDVSGGDGASIPEATRRAMDVSMHLELHGAAGAALTWSEAFYLATLGGAKALKLDKKTGNFEVGKEFDALFIDAYAHPGPVDKFAHATAATDPSLSLLQKFIYLGDDRNIRQVYVKGRKVKDILCSKQCSN